MTKAELIEKIAKDAGIPKTTAKIAFDSVFAGIKQGVQKKGHKVTLVGFGTFKNVYRKLEWVEILRPVKISKLRARV